MSESRVPAGATVRVSLLTGPLRNYFHDIQRPAATGCGACHRPWAEHRDTRKRPVIRMFCERCGIEFSDRCYFRRVATPVERLLFSLPFDDSVAGLIFLCAGCRS